MSDSPEAYEIARLTNELAKVRSILTQKHQEWQADKERWSKIGDWVIQHEGHCQSAREELFKIRGY